VLQIDCRDLAIARHPLGDETLDAFRRIPRRT
jgi:hypothetical protein